MSESAPLPSGWRIFAIVFCGVFSVLYGLLPWVSQWGSAFAAFGIANGVVMWCYCDTVQRGKVFVHSFGWLILCTWPVALPIYLLHTRGVKGILPSIGSLAGMLALAAMGGFWGMFLFDN